MIEVGRVGMVPIDLVTIDERARKEMGDLNGLENDMKESGLIQPLAMKLNEDGTYQLLAGERRFTVLQRNGNSEVPARIYDKDLSDLEMKVIEKSENFFRKDFEYWELDSLTLEIHNLQQQLHGISAPGPSSDGWTKEDTGNLIGMSQPQVTRAIQRATAREAYPELFEGCKTASDASKVLSKVNEAIIRQKLAEKLETGHANVDLQKLSSCYIVRDFFEGVREIPDGVMHLVEIDPPYGIRLTDQKRKDGESQYSLENYNEISSEDYPKFLSRTFKECYRVMAQHSWLICWFAPHPWFEEVYKAITSSGLETTKMCGIWTKNSPGQNMNPAIRLSNSYEMFFYAWKGQPALNKAGRSNDFNFSPVPPSQKVHPTERPLDLMRELYETFAFPGSRILIPFLGSGSGLLAANSLGMSAVGFELSKAYKDSFLVKAHAMKS